MAVALLIEIPGGTRAQYEGVIKDLRLGGKMPEGGMYHFAGRTDDGWCVIDVWATRKDFDRFMEERLAEAIQRNGVPQPRISEISIHNSMYGYGVPVP